MSFTIPEEGYEHEFTWPAGNNGTVIVTGTFDNWSGSLRHLTRRENGIWSEKVSLRPGDKVLYKYVVDGHWVHNSELPTETDSSGNTNNVFNVPQTSNHSGIAITPVPAAVAAPVTPVSTSATTTSPIATTTNNAPVKRDEQAPATLDDVPDIIAAKVDAAIDMVAHKTEELLNSPKAKSFAAVVSGAASSVTEAASKAATSATDIGHKVYDAGSKQVQRLSVSSGSAPLPNAGASENPIEPVPSRAAPVTDHNSIPTVPSGDQIASAVKSDPVPSAVSAPIGQVGPHKAEDVVAKQTAPANALDPLAAQLEAQNKLSTGSVAVDNIVKDLSNLEFSKAGEGIAAGLSTTGSAIASSAGNARKSLDANAPSLDKIESSIDSGLMKVDAALEKAAASVAAMLPESLTAEAPSSTTQEAQTPPIQKPADVIVENKQVPELYPASGSSTIPAATIVVDKPEEPVKPDENMVTPVPSISKATNGVYTPKKQASLNANGIANTPGTPEYQTAPSSPSATPNDKSTKRKSSFFAKVKSALSPHKKDKETA